VQKEAVTCHPWTLTATGVKMNTWTRTFTGSQHILSGARMPPHTTIWLINSTSPNTIHMANIFKEEDLQSELAHLRTLMETLALSQKNPWKIT